MHGGTPFLPQEIITNILIRLPVQSLIRFQCVSKHWKNLIKTPYFITKHLHHSTYQNSCLLLQGKERDDLMHLYLLNRELQVLEFLKRDDLSCDKIISSSNGLLCVEIDKYIISPSSLLLCNPATREVKEVPRSRTIDDFEGTYSLGFGFSPLIKDFKIVRTYAPQYNTEVNLVEVYSLSTGSWKEIELGNLKRVALSFFWETVTFNGAVFWTGSKLRVEEEDEDKILVVLSFDIAREVFNLIPWPALDNNSTGKLTVYDNKLAIISLNVIGTFESSFVDLWVMEEGTGALGERWTWNKKYRSSTYPCCLHPVTLWGNDIICNVIECEVKHQKPIASYELGMLIICGCVYGIFNYVESLVPISL